MSGIKSVVLSNNCNSVSEHFGRSAFLWFYRQILEK